MRTQCAALFAVVACGVAARSTSAQTPYAITRLDFTPAAINASGFVVGRNASSHACVYANGQTVDLGTLGGSSSAATGINAAGQIVGYSTTQGDVATHAFIFANGQMTDLGTLPGGSESRAAAINDSGVVTGDSYTTQPGTTYPTPDHAFIYSAGHMTDLGNVSASNQFVNFSQGKAINQAGQVAGWSNTDGGTPRAFLYTGGHMTDLGTLPSPLNYGSYANAIDTAGDVAGFSEDENFVKHAFLYSNGAMKDLGVPSGYNNSVALAMNDNGQIVGKISGGSTEPSQFAFLYSGSTGFVNIRSLIDDPNISIDSVAGINNAGQIIATGSDFGPDGGGVVAFILTPNGTGNPTPTPQPSTTPAPTPAPTPTGPLRFVGPVGWSTPNGASGVLTANQITYNQTSGTSGTVRLELWAFANAFTGAATSGYRVATYSLAPLQAGASYTTVNSGTIPFTAPPNGWWHMAMLLTEYTGQYAVDDGYVLEDWLDFSNPYVVGGSAAPAPTPAQLANISTRGVIQSGDNVMIGGFIVTGSASKKVIVRGIGPSLPVNGALADPMLELHGANGTIATNDNWQESQQSDIAATGVAPTNELEPALIATLPGNNAGYTAILSGKNGAGGIGLVEVYDLSAAPGSTLANISTRGFVDTGDNVMIGGFITTPSSGAAKILVRGIGPSLTAAGVSGALADPVLELHDANGGTIASNDNWRDTQQSEIQSTGIPPSNDAESALVQTLWAGNYTAILRGKNGTGVGLVEIYRLQ